MAHPTGSVLIADDEFYIRTALAGHLRKMGLEVAGEAGDGEEAVALFRSLRPDLLLLDINMPHVTGLEALKAIRQEFPSAKVILLTSLADEETVDQCLALGAANFFRKDTPFSELAPLIREALAPAPET